MWRFKLSNIVLIISMFCSLGCKGKEPNELKADQYVVRGQEDEISQELTTYFFTHLSKRSLQDSPLVYWENQAPKSSDVLRISWIIDTSMQQDYCITNLPGDLSIKARERSTATWLVYQLLEAISQSDARVDTRDLPVAHIKFQSGCHTFDFRYREPYLQSNLHVDAFGVLGNNNVENHWGIWGHNLAKLVQGLQDKQIYSEIDKQINTAQLCFSSTALYEHLKQYIIDQFGFGQKYVPTRFMIMPLDNELVCECQKCVRLGNTAQFASNAVYNFIDALARDFPNHEFFMVAYKTTIQLPRATIRPNVGVFVSAIDLDKGSEVLWPKHPKAATKEFVDLVEQWNAKGLGVYVWDYSANFDDYLTPLPVLFGLAQRLNWYKTLGIKGVFFNGAGYDYSAFEELQTHVISALLKDTSVDVATMIEQYFEKFYPTSAPLLTRFYLELEHRYAQKNKAYDMYGSMQSNLQSYAEMAVLKKFYNKIEHARINAAGKERLELDKLYISLTFSMAQMQLAQSSQRSGDALGYKWKDTPWIQILKEAHSVGILNYKESDGLLGDYIGYLEQIKVMQSQQNLLKSVALSVQGQALQGVGYLSDGLPGYGLDYHLGWYIHPQKVLAIAFDAMQPKGGYTLEIRFLQSHKFRFDLPKSIQVFDQSGAITINNDKWIELAHGVRVYQVEIDLSANQRIELLMEKKPGHRNAIAIDEIILTKLK